MVLGPDPDARYERGYVEVRAGDAILLYSDGITEAENAIGEAFGLDRLEQLLRTHQGRSAREIVELIFREVELYSRRNTPVDDQTVVVIRHPDKP